MAPLAPLIAQTEETAIALLGEARFDAEFGAGKRMDRQAAIALALGESGQAAAAPRGPGDRARGGGRWRGDRGGRPAAPGHPPTPNAAAPALFQRDRTD